MEKYKYCPDCGAYLELRDLGDEIGVPWCERCRKPWFPVFPVAVISLVYNDNGDVLLLKQNYISEKYYNLVSGYVTPGENADSCAIREVFEETGLKVDNLELILTQWFEKKEILMVGFFAHISDHNLALSSEVDSARWVKTEDMLPLLHQNETSTSRQLAIRFLKRSGLPIP